MRPPIPLGIARLRLCRRRRVSPIDVLIGAAAMQRRGDLRESTSLGERAGTLARSAARGARQLAEVLRMDDRQSRSCLRRCLAGISRSGVTDSLGSAAATAPCAVSHAEPVNHCRRSLGSRGAKTRPRARVGRTPTGCRHAVSVAACPRRKHHQARELSAPTIGHQLQMPPTGNGRRDWSTATQTPSSTEWVIRHRCLRSACLPGNHADGAPGVTSQTLSSYKSRCN
jgi:hypothetical protein